MYSLKLLPPQLKRTHLTSLKKMSAGLHSIKERENLNKYYKILNLPLDSDQEQLRNTFLNLVKRFHPDSGTPEANVTKFTEIETAYRKIQEKFAKERWQAADVGGEYGLYYDEKKTEEIKEYDIKHTAPQHRQYLSFDGVGTGTPGQRQKQHQKYRAAVAIDNVYDHRIRKLGQSSEDALVIKDKREARKIKTRFGMDRLVEDLIQESMSRGEFDNLAGKGKPLPEGTINPYVDFVTHKINQVLIDNGFTPEWISLQKEIKEEIAFIRDRLTESRGNLGPLPLSTKEQYEWEKSIEQLQPLVKKLNAKISKFNLVVPLMKKQLILMKIEVESDRELREGKTVQERGPRSPTSRQINSEAKQTSSSNQNTFISLLSSFFH